MDGWMDGIYVHYLFGTYFGNHERRPMPRYLFRDVSRQVFGDVGQAQTDLPDVPDVV